MDDTSDPSPTLLAGRYQLGRALGQGGMADVHRALDLRLEREVAVKVLRAGADSPAGRARFSAEIGVLARLHHPALVTLLDAVVGEGRSFLVMELVDGPTLRQAVLEHGALPPARVGSIGAQLAAGLAYAHEHGVVHRDVKPANVLLDADADGRARLGDFGIARVLGDTLRHTDTGMAVGTAAYLAPEQVTGEDRGGSACDVYALGLVLLEALTGEHPFPGTAPESMAARLHRPPAVPDDLSPHWQRLLTAMTRTDPAQRPSADEVAVELGLGATQAMAVVPVEVWPPEPAASPVRRPPLAALATALGLTAAVLTGGLLLGGPSSGSGSPVGDPAQVTPAAVVEDVVPGTAPAGTTQQEAVVVDAPEPVAATSAASSTSSTSTSSTSSSSGAPAARPAGGPPAKAKGKPAGKAKAPGKSKPKSHGRGHRKH